ADKQVGLSSESLADIFPPYLQANRFARFNNQLLSFPFTKSNLVMYYNKDLLKRAGFSKPPETWDELLAQCRVISAKSTKPCWALALDASTLDGFIFSYGGELLSPDQKSTLFDQPPTVKMLEMLGRATSEKLAYRVPGPDLGNEFSNGHAAFAMGSSNGRLDVERHVGKK